jgi:hypothetical protein
VVELNYLDSNPRFDMCIVFTANYFLMGGDVLIDSETFLVIDFMNLKIKLTQPFRDTHRDRVYVCIHRSACSYISICVFTVFLKK